MNLLYLSPEYMMTDPMLDVLDKHNLALISVDETHCISQRGVGVAKLQACADVFLSEIAQQQDCNYLCFELVSRIFGYRSRRWLTFFAMRSAAS